MSAEQSFTTLHLPQAWAMPDEVPVETITENALQAAFKVIADGLADAGYPVTGDFSPWESLQLDDAFATFVRAMALNNPAILELQDES